MAVIPLFAGIPAVYYWPMHRFTAGLTPAQIGIVIGIFWFTAIGALLAAIAFRWVNLRR